MKEQIDKLKKSLEILFTEENSTENSNEMANNPFIDMIENGLSWCLHHLCPFLMIALAIDIFIMFNIPAQIALSRWFWLKDPLSIGIAWLISRKLLRIL